MKIPRFHMEATNPCDPDIQRIVCDVCGAVGYRFSTLFYSSGEPHERQVTEPPPWAIPRCDCFNDIREDRGDQCTQQSN